MRFIGTAVVVALATAFAAPAHAAERVGPAALGALSGAVVLGPVGLVAGAVIGYTAGPEIGRAWKVRRVDPRHARPAKRPVKRTAQAAVKRHAAPPPRGAAPGEVTPSGRGTGGPPAQGLE
jgi:hypothetical protein